MEGSNNTLLPDAPLIGPDAPEVGTKKEVDPEEQAAFFINTAHKEFRRLAFALADRKRHAVSRVLEAVLFEPLEQVELLGKHEQELFAICQQIMYNKGVVLQYAMKSLEEKSQKEKSNG